MGTTTIVAWNIGAGDIKKHGMLPVKLLWPCCTRDADEYSWYNLGPHIVEFMGREQIRESLRSILSDYFSGLAVSRGCHGYYRRLRGAGDTKIPMVYNVGSNLLNILKLCFNLWEMGFPQLGVAGAGISTTIARALTCLAGLYVLYFWKGSKIVINFKTRFRISFALIKKFFP